jgi:hypothetical protein
LFSTEFSTLMLQVLLPLPSVGWAEVVGSVGDAMGLVGTGDGGLVVGASCVDVLLA